MLLNYMNKYDLSVLIPARNEVFLVNTVQSVLSGIRGNTEIIVVLDGAWADPYIPDDPRLTLVYLPESIGQRAATNLACRMSRAKYVMKLDAHCAVDEGFDVKLIADMQDDWTVIPAMYNLHAFDWVCPKCNSRQYQGPSDKYEKCPTCGTNRIKEIIFKPRLNRRSEFYRFDKTLHFQYWGDFKNRPEGRPDIAPMLTAQGSCFFLTRKKYIELNICDDKAAGKSGWGQQGVEVALKTWLSGGQLMLNKKTWYSHMFRTQGGDFGFPYHLSDRDVQKAREISKKLWIENTWPQALPGRNLQWLLDKFAPVPEWHDNKQHQMTPNDTEELTRGIIFYTDNKVNTKIAHKVQDKLRETELPIVSSSLKPMPHFGTNIHLPLERGYLTMFKQQLAALEALDADIVYMCEHDVLYHPSHFDFIPPRNDIFYYNTNVWKVDWQSGHALWVNECRQVSGLVAYRQLLVEEYRKRIERVEKEGKFERGWGFEPGTKNLDRGGFSDYTASNFQSKQPNIDIRSDHNLTPNRWRKDQFRNQKNTEGWTESHIAKIPGWRDPFTSCIAIA